MDQIGKVPAIHPRPTIGRRLDATARAAFPAGCTVVLMLLTLTPFGFADQAQLLPAIALTSVWFWSLYRPLQMPPFVVFAIGLLLDLLGYLPLGADLRAVFAPARAGAGGVPGGADDRAVSGDRHPVCARASHGRRSGARMTGARMTRVRAA